MFMLNPTKFCMYGALSLLTLMPGLALAQLGRCVWETPASASCFARQ